MFVLIVDQRKNMKETSTNYQIDIMELLTKKKALIKRALV